MFPFKVVQEDTINIALLHTGVIKIYGMIKFSLVILLIKTDWLCCVDIIDSQLILLYYYYY